MAASLGPNLIEDGLVLSYDFSDRNTYLPYSLINMLSWTVGTGGVTGYGENADAANENQRFSGTNPWGDTDIIWGSFPSGNGNADGGWVTSANYSIDKTKMYRFSVWVRRTSSTTGGTAYLGCNAWDSGQYIKRTVDSVDEANPYWYYANIGDFAQNTWYLLVGHLYPFNTTYTGRHPDSGIYNVNNITKIGSIGGNTVGGDFKFASTSTYVYQRVFHYYCGDTTSRLQWYDPRIDLIDGTEPSIYELVTRSAIKTRDINNNSYSGILNNKVTYNTSNKGIFTFDGIDDYIDIGTNLSTNFSSNQITVCAFARISSVVSKNTLVSFNGAFNFFLPGNRLTTTYQLYWDSVSSWKNGTKSNWSTNTWYYLCWTISSTTLSFYVNGVLDGTAILSTTFAPSSSTRIGFANVGEYATGDIANILIYNRALSAAEVLQNFNANKGRFGL